LIIKPINGVSSLDVFRADTPTQLFSALEQVKQPIIQEFIDGKEFTVDVLADTKSRVLSVVPRERIEVKAGISYKGRTVRSAGLAKAARKIAEALKVKGPCNIQCRLRQDEAWFFEVNPRFSGTLPLTIAAGVNGPVVLLRLALGELVGADSFKYKSGVYMARYWNEVFY
jgi:carbamoyl-phosphate synthase large subunit